MKQVVVVWTGGRGSGKTLSMSAEGVRAMARGKSVWSNYPIAFNLVGRDGLRRHLQSTIIDMPDLLEIQRRDEIRDGLVLLDEWNFFVNSRRSGAVANLIFSGVVQLIRKRKLSFYITTQDFNTLDKNIRFQCDVTVNCFDLSFAYRNLSEGAIISQRVTDWTGVYTGHPLLKADDWDMIARNSYTRLFVKASRYFGTFPTGFEFDVLEAFSNKYALQKQEKVIGGSGLTDDGYEVQRLMEIRKELVSHGMERCLVQDTPGILRDYGIEGNPRAIKMKENLNAAGWFYHHTRRGNFYELREDFEVEQQPRRK